MTWTNLTQLFPSFLIFELQAMTECFSVCLHVACKGVIVMASTGPKGWGRPFDQLQGGQLSQVLHWGEGLNSLLFHILEGFSWPVLLWQECALGLLGCCQSLGPETRVSRILPKIRLRNLDAGWHFKQQLQPNWHSWENLGESQLF